MSCLPEDFAATKAGYSRRVYPKALIMGPTRELTNQIYEESRKFTYQTGLRPVVVYGGAPVSDQVRGIMSAQLQSMVACTHMHAYAAAAQPFPACNCMHQ